MILLNCMKLQLLVIIALLAITLPNALALHNSANVTSTEIQIANFTQQLSLIEEASPDYLELENSIITLQEHLTGLQADIIVPELTHDITTYLIADKAIYESGNDIHIHGHMSDIEDIEIEYYPALDGSTLDITMQFNMKYNIQVNIVTSETTRRATTDTQIDVRCPHIGENNTSYIFSKYNPSCFDIDKDGYFEFTISDLPDGKYTVIFNYYLSNHSAHSSDYGHFDNYFQDDETIYNISNNIHFIIE